MTFGLLRLRSSEAPRIWAHLDLRKILSKFDTVKYPHCCCAGAQHLGSRTMHAQNWLFEHVINPYFSSKLLLVLKNVDKSLESTKVF